MEAVRGGAVKAYLTGAGIAQFPLPMTYDGGDVREYGALIPFNTALTVFVSSSSLHLTATAGAALSPSGIPVQVSSTDFQLPSPLPHSLARMFPPPTAKVVTHVCERDPVSAQIC